MKVCKSIFKRLSEEAGKLEIQKKKKKMKTAKIKQK